MQRNTATSLLLATLAIALAGCGYSPGDRAASGGLLGAGGGAAIAAATGGSPLTGALIGGGAGALGGEVLGPLLLHRVLEAGAGTVEAAGHRAG